MDLELNLKRVGITSTFLGLTFLLVFTNVNSVEDNVRCPAILKNLTCDRIQCKSVFGKYQCPPGTMYIENFALCGCCSSCVKYISLGDRDCVSNDDSKKITWTPDSNCTDEGVCPVTVNTCLPGLVCSEATPRKCELPQNIPGKSTGECMFRKSLKHLESIHWDPDCEPDGSFSPKQCKGSKHDGECFCVDRSGNRIFGREWSIKAENQTCACSRKTYELREVQGLTATFHCSPDGNYEPLQCDTDSGVCYCVDSQTGKLDGAMLPESQWKSLPCFSLNLTDHHKDGKYLRKCESEFAGLRQLSIIGNEHGATMELKNVLCSYDGSYAPVQRVSTTTQCMFQNGTRIKDFSMPRNEAMTCNCARDKYQYFPSEHKSFDYDCEQRSGNYEPVYDFGSIASCMDKDGFLYGEPIESKYFCCLMNTGCSEETKKECYNEVDNPDGVKPCSYWRYQS